MTVQHSTKRCTKCGEEKSLDQFSAGRAYKDGRKTICKACHAAKYSAAAGYVKPADMIRRAERAARTKLCDCCGKHVLLLDWPRQKAGHLSPRCKPCLEELRTPKPKKMRTAEQRAEYRRRAGKAKAIYVPRALAIERAAERKAQKRSKKYDWHVRARDAWLRSEDRRLLHDAHVKLYRSETVQFRLKYNSDPEFAVRQRLRTQLRKKAKLFPKLDDLMRDAIKRCGTSPTVERVCGYSIAELVAHLESLFTDGMTWERFLNGDIHIDHVKPQRLFDLSNPGEVRACWALSNLQPLWAEDNLAKGGAYECFQNEKVLGNDLSIGGNCAP